MDGLVEWLHEVQEVLNQETKQNTKQRKNSEMKQHKYPKMKELARILTERPENQKACSADKELDLFLNPSAHPEYLELCARAVGLERDLRIVDDNWETLTFVKVCL